MPNASCTRNCWIAGAVLGFLVWIITAGIGPSRWYEGLFLGLIAAGLMGRFLQWLLCQGTPAESEADREPQSSTGYAGSGQAGATAVGLLASNGAKASRDASAEVGPSGDARLQGSGTARSMSERNDIYGGASGTKSADDETGAADAPAKAPKDKVGASSAKAGKGDAKPAKLGKGKSGTAKADKGKEKSKTAKDKSTKPAKPAKPAKPKSGKQEPADDLKEIKGVGPKLEKLLRKQGVTRFAQIAEWGEDEMDHFAELIGRMGGRIRSDDWVGQARTLAQGGETEFSKRVEKGDVY